MTTDRLGDGLKDQFADVFEVLRKAIESFDSAEWVSGRPPYDGPARGAVHALQCAEFYTNRDARVWDRFGKPVWKMTPDELPPADALLAYLDEAQARTMAWIDQLVAEGLEKKSDDFGRTALESIVYAMRHLQHHTGEVCAWQKQFGHPQEHWT